MDTMMALRAHSRGGPEQLAYERAPRPEPGPEEALVEVHAAGITFTELGWDATWLTADGRDRTPVIPSHEVSGRVAALGPEASGSGTPSAGAPLASVGDEVFGLVRFDRNGALAHERGITATFFIVSPQRDELARLAALIDGGRLRPIVAQTFPLSEGRRAYESGPKGTGAGKTVLTVR
jgi:NADPH:quinone reductase-like Zn-dependent oxidoreductase